MGEYDDFRTPDRDEWGEPTNESEPPPSKQAQQEIAHDRGRICKKRGCVVCAPLVERRREKKKQRKADAQASLHAKGRPCGRKSCELAVCVDARAAAATGPPPAESNTQTRSNTQTPSTDAGRPDADRPDPDRVLRRQAERHRVELPCGSQDCPITVCVDGFANERTRRHRAGRPCRSTMCDNPTCVSARSTT